MTLSWLEEAQLIKRAQRNPAAMEALWRVHKTLVETTSDQAYARTAKKSHISNSVGQDDYRQEASIVWWNVIPNLDVDNHNQVKCHNFIKRAIWLQLTTNLYKRQLSHRLNEYNYDSSNPQYSVVANDIFGIETLVVLGEMAKHETTKRQDNYMYHAGLSSRKKSCIPSTRTLHKTQFKQSLQRLGL